MGPSPLPAMSLLCNRRRFGKPAESVARTRGRFPARVWGAAAAVISAVVGAGFASGREVAQFFAVFGPRSAAGIVIATVLLGGLSLATMTLASRHQAQDHGQLLSLLLPGALGHAAALVIDMMTFQSLTVMLSGSATALSLTWQLDPEVTSALTALLALGIAFRGHAAFMGINGWLGVLLCLGIFWVTSLPPAPSVQADIYMLPPSPGSPLSNWMVAAVLYAGYNFPTLGALFVSLRPGRRSSHRERHIGVVIGLSIIGYLLARGCTAIQEGGPAVLHSPMPFLLLAQMHPPGAVSPTALYAAILWLAMFSTALANLLVLRARLQQWFHRRQLVLVLLALLTFCSWMLADVGFASLVGWGYPAFGIIGMAMPVAVVITGGVRRRSRSIRG